jgi:hypothetical protein
VRTLDGLTLLLVLLLVAAPASSGPITHVNIPPITLTATGYGHDVSAALSAMGYDRNVTATLTADGYSREITAKLSATGHHK